MTKTRENAPDLVLAPCPFCGGRPRVDLAKKEHCQLHGEPSQRVAIYCYHDCAARPRVEAGDVFNGGMEAAQQKAAAAWNRRAPASPVPAPAYGVKALEWSENYANTPIGRYAIRCTPDGYEVSVDGEEIAHLGFDAPRAQPSARDAARDYAQADFERCILSCLSPAPVEEADAKARPSDDQLWDQTLTERDNYHDAADKLAEAIGELLGVNVGEHSSAHSPWENALEHAGQAVRNREISAPTIPSEPEAKGEAGAGTVGEAVANYIKNTTEIDTIHWVSQSVRDAMPRTGRLYARPVDEPGEVERLTRERDACTWAR